jgi:hypothetical protein
MITYDMKYNGTARVSQSKTGKQEEDNPIQGSLRQRQNRTGSNSYRLASPQKDDGQAGLARRGVTFLRF